MPPKPAKILKTASDIQSASIEGRTYRKNGHIYKAATKTSPETDTGIPWPLHAEIKGSGVHYLDKNGPTIAFMWKPLQPKERRSKAKSAGKPAPALMPNPEREPTFKVKKLSPPEQEQQPAPSFRGEL